MAKNEDEYLSGVIDQLTRTHWMNVPNKKLRKIQSIMNMTDEQFQAEFGKDEESMKPVIELHYNQSGLRGGKVGCIIARLKDDHRIHSAGMNEEEAVFELLRTLESISRPCKKDYYTYKKIINPFK
jgi:hypothetical protein